MPRRPRLSLPNLPSHRRALPRQEGVEEVVGVVDPGGDVPPPPIVPEGGERPPRKGPSRDGAGGGRKGRGGDGSPPDDPGDDRHDDDDDEGAGAVRVSTWDGKIISVTSRTGKVAEKIPVP